ncbi:hypothetical protein B0H14DRAFT_2612960 [Mycena olivaceomarginata]|nr:hypothetical protein B0H14DRAFT_2612960 [Mycena olivaceomarginata]
MESGHPIGVAYSAEQRVNMSRFQNDLIRERALPQGRRQRCFAEQRKAKKTGEEWGENEAREAERSHRDTYSYLLHLTCEVCLQRKRVNKPAQRKRNEFQERYRPECNRAEGMPESVTRRSDRTQKGTLTEDPSRHIGRAHPHLRLINAAYASSVSQDFTKIDQPECLHIHQQSVCPQTRSLDEGSASRSTNTAVIMCFFIQREAHKFAGSTGARSPKSHAHIGVYASRVVVSGLALPARSPSHRRGNQRWDLRTNYGREDERSRYPPSDALTETARNSLYPGRPDGGTADRDGVNKDSGE